MTLNIKDICSIIRESVGVVSVLVVVLVIGLGQEGLIMR